jgi:putative ABC transport system ATP-binding protein
MQPQTDRMDTLTSTELTRHAMQDPLRVVGLTKTYGPAGNRVTALAGVTTSFAAGTFTAVMGPSGSGKTTLLHCASGLDRPTTGTVHVDGREFAQGSEAVVTRFRRTRIGFVFQQYNLLPTLTALQNVALPTRLAGKKVHREKCLALLDQVGLSGHAGRRPAEMSGGQQQRVAIARALASRPSIVFADEPTGALDGVSAATVLALLRRAVDEHGQTIVMVTHDPIAAAFADSVVFLADGRIVGAMKNPSAAAVSAQMLRLDPTHRSGGQR